MTFDKLVIADQHIEHDYETRGIVVIDHATGLMWQQSGSSYAVDYQQAEEYVEELNKNNFVGFHNWRLPTIQELSALFDTTKKNKNPLFDYVLYIDPVFDIKQAWCWSSSIIDELGMAWCVLFNSGILLWGMSHHKGNFVRAVRTIQKGEEVCK